MNRDELALFFGRVHHVRFTGCWVWLAALDGAGYGVHDQRGAHVRSHEMFIGPVPPGFHVDHLCMNKQCVNPAHLEAVTPAENARRYSSLVLCCKRGHPRTPENIRRWKNNNAAGYANYCIVCRRLTKERLRSQRRTA